MKSLVIAVLCLVFTSCATRYGIVAGGQQVTYKESADINPFVSGSSFNLGDHEMKAQGFHIGISEETPNFLTKIVYFQNSYKDETMNILGTNFDTKLKETGFRFSLAWKLGFFHPYIFASSYKSKIQVNDLEDSNSYTALGYGADLEFQIGRKTFFYVGVTQDKAEGFAPAPPPAWGLMTTELKHMTILMGLRFNFQEDYSR